MNRSWDIFSNINEFIRFSDTKAGVILAFAGGSAAVLSSKVDVLHAIIAAHRHDVGGWMLYIAVFVYLLSLMVAINLALRSIWPSLDGGEKRSLIYFKHICEDYGKDHRAYGTALSSLEDAAMEDELAHQICVNASVAARKFELVGRAIKALSSAISAWAVIVFIILLLGAAAPVRA